LNQTTGSKNEVKTKLMTLGLARKLLTTTTCYTTNVKLQYAYI